MSPRRCPAWTGGSAGQLRLPEREREVKDIQTVKRELELSLSADGTILYTEILSKSQSKMLERTAYRGYRVKDQYIKGNCLYTSN